MEIKKKIAFVLTKLFATKFRRKLFSAHSQAHLQFAQADTKTQNCKRACLFSNAFLPTRKNEIKIVLN